MKIRLKVAKPSQSDKLVQEEPSPSENIEGKKERIES